MIKVSAIVPAYNCEKTISKTIDSLISQDYNFYEIIVVDDGSIDKTSLIASKYPVKLLKKKWGGEASALNTAVKAVSNESKYIAIVEADVILPQNWVSALLLEFDNQKVLGVGAALEIANPENLISKLCGYELENRYNSIKDKFVPHITSANTLYKKEVFDKIGYYDESLINAALDSELNGRIIENEYKLVFRKDIKVKHFWKTNLFSYLKRNFFYSFYRPFQKSLLLYPTDRMIIFEMILILLFILSFLSWPFFGWGYYLTASFLAISFLIELPIAIKILKVKNDFSSLLLVPMIFLRNIVAFFAYGLGVLFKLFKHENNIFNSTIKE